MTWTVPPPSRRRRGALLVGIAIVVVIAVVAAVGAVLVVRSRAHGHAGTVRGSGNQDQTTATPAWNAVVATKPESGELVVYDPDGKETGRVATGLTDAFVTSVRGQYVLVEGDDSQFAVVDVAAADVAWRSKPSGERPQWAYRTKAPVLLVPSADDDVAVIDFATGTQLDLADEFGTEDARFVPLSVRVAPDGTLLVASDLEFGAPLASLLVDLTTGTTAKVPGVGPAFTGDGAVTLEAAQDLQSTTARFFSRDGQQVATATLPAATTAVFAVDDQTLIGYADDRGGPTVFRAAAGDAEASVLDHPDVGPDDQVIPFPDASRLVVESEGRVLVIDPDGNEVADLAGTIASAATPAWDAKCLQVRTDDGFELVSLSSGDVLASAPSDDQGTVQASDDGCVLSGPGLLLTPAGPVDVDHLAYPVLSADGTAALVRDESGVQLLDLGRPDAEPVTFDALGAAFVRVPD